MTDAVVYIPESVGANDGLYARRGVAHIERSGHRFAGVLRKWEQVLVEAAKGAVVVFACQEHAARHSRYAGIRREFVGEETCRLIPIVQERAAAYQANSLSGRHRGSAPLSDESPTVAILDRRRIASGPGNATNERTMTPTRLPGPIHTAAQLVEETARLWGHGKPR